MKLKAKELQCLMAERSLLVKDGADMCNVSVPTFSRAIRGQDISTRTAGKIARGFNVKIHKIVRKQET